MKLPEGKDGLTIEASPPSRGAWIEISKFSSKHSTRTSPPSRGAWIEIGLRLTA